MKEYQYPASIEEAVRCLAAHRGAARIVAGGTDLLVDLRESEATPSCLVDVTRIPALNEIVVGETFVTVGAAVTFAEIRRHPWLRKNVHALAAAAGSVGAAAIQNVATWVGNIVQAMPAADGSVVAVALDAEACVVDGEGASWRPVHSLFRGPGVSAIDSTRQLVTHLRFRRPGANTGTAWGRVGRRSALVLPILNCAVKLQIEARAGTPQVKHAAIALGPVAPRPFRASGAEAFLEERALTERTFADAGRVAQKEANPRTSVMRASCDYRLAIIPNMVSEALAEAARMALR
jgi:carbon-monoxide dehydrogenase medium subunit